LNELRKAVIEFAKSSMATERLSQAGRVNTLGILAAFVLVVGAGAFDGIQVIVRAWSPHYTTGFPSFLSILIAFGVLFLLCVLILALVPPRDGDHP